MYKYEGCSKIGVMTFLLVFFLSGCNNNSDSGGGTAADTTAPTVSSTNPSETATGVEINRKAIATFDEAMDPATITPLTFTLTQGATPVSGAVTYAAGSKTATFTPASNLAISVVVTATMATGAKDLAGNALASNKTWTFTTGTAADATPPTVSSTNPADGGGGVAINANIAVTFSEAIDPATCTATTLTLKQGTTPFQGAVTCAGAVVTFDPISALVANTTYTATLTTEAKDLAGNALAATKTWSFTTGATADTTAPIVSSTNPANTATGVAINANITATFSEAIDPRTCTTSTFTLKQGTTLVPSAVTCIGAVATLNPAGNLVAGAVYTALITTGVKDLGRNALAVNKTWSFTAGTVPAAGPAPVVLGTAGSFAILAKSGISTTGVTSIVGDIGVSPIDQTAITGFSETRDPSGQFSTAAPVTGHIFAADYAVPTPNNLTTAIGDMEIAYTDAAGRTSPDFTELGAGDISGATLVPGLYKWGTGVTIDSSGVTLSGGANDVWIFQVAQDLSVSSGAIISLNGGAQAKNVFWQVAGQATLGTTSNVKGIILSKTLIAFNTGAVITGRALTQTAVTLNATTITSP